jgi:putative ATP-dependent endonuclease of the OLD family
MGYTITFDPSTTSIVGKNNTGKTSLTSIFKTFLSDKNFFSFEEFSLQSHNQFINTYKCFKSITEKTKEHNLLLIQKDIPKIQLFLTVQYDEKDNWANIKPFFIELSEESEFTILCEYAPDYTEKFIKDIDVAMEGLEYSDDELLKKISSIYKNYYKITFKPYSAREETDTVKRSDINNLIQAKFITAQRVLDDSDAESKSPLSKIFRDQFNYLNMQDISKSKELIKLIEDASRKIDGELINFFDPFLKYFKSFGFPGLSKEKVELMSNLDPENLFKHNISLFYNLEGKKLPEKYNGLGYSNLIYIISQIIGFYSEIKDSQNNLNIIFIEEPEAHMHPQMQSVFINNIENFLTLDEMSSQIIITTHSPHILSDSKLESIRYFTSEKNEAVVKDLMRFNNSLTGDDPKEFLQQYLTLGKCDLFFADKAILFEGTVERILLPVFIEKVEKAELDNKLSEQYISSIEIGGAYMSKFKELLDFLDLKTLIITDIDSINKDSKEKNEVKLDETLITSNVTLNDWIPGKSKIEELLDPKIAKENENGTIRVAYQKNVNPIGEPVKCGRSFEEAFIINNDKYIIDNKGELLSINYAIKDYSSASQIKDESYEIQKFIDRNRKKTEFAFDLLSVKKNDWVVPNYIEEGLEWLAK